MEKKWCLLKNSDGNRGLAGKKKIYEVTVDGTKVTYSWGMAEKSTRQTFVDYGKNETSAFQLAMMKVNFKIESGYEIAYTV
jgi:hypothetical protein